MTDELGAHLRNGFDAQLNITSNQNQYLTKSFNVMKKIIRHIAFFAIVAFIFTSCTSKHGMAYNKHLRNNGKCLISSEGCGWSK